ncbi:lysostaphin resistance A-like protein [Arenimonas sp.]|uniref:CPBP family intramembrane glutamic endopeptidase n=1 Tax=Arenimonas sp. TaxID=1872635 RepID=UPI0035B345B2
MSPTSTSEDTPPAGGASDNPPLPPAATKNAPPPRPWLGFTIDAALAVVLLMVVSILLITPLVLVETFASPGRPSDEVLQAMLPQITVAAIVSMLLAALATWMLRGRNMVGELPRSPLGPALAWSLLAGVGIQLLVLAIDAGLGFLDAPLTPSNAEPIEALARQWPWLTWVLVVIVGPFAEELLFRHVLLRRFALAGRVLAGLVATSALFALLHEVGQGADRSLAAWFGILAVYLAMGMGFGLVYVRTGRLWAAFAAHAACNATAMAIAAFST